ncbi:MAG TPA: hypothetical protein VFQ53_14530 [Kofleriaceae bacterium]|nr:hypothetical protein [Kofleriaceae bacterium]
MSAGPALADEAAPTPAQMEAAKKAFAEGKKLHDKGKLPEAIEKFKESYNLSKNPLLLYNIGLTMEEAAMDDLALYYYRKFLADAPQDAQQRGTVSERVKVLEKKFGSGGAIATTEPAKPSGGKTETKIKPAGTYSATDFQHQIVEAAPPGKPLDVTAFVPEDSGFTVTLYYRTAGEAQFTQKPMKWRYKELVARIPAAKMAGSSVQYYVEVKDHAGTVVTRSGKSTSPNLVNIEAGASPRFYPDVSDDGEVKTSAADVTAHDEEDDPLSKSHPKPKTDDTVVVQPTEPGPPGTGFRDVGSTKFTYMKWGSTAAAATLVGAGVLFMIEAGKYASSLEEDSTQCGAPPCRTYDSYAADLEKSGKRFQTLSNISYGVGAVATAVAGYYWYKELTAKKRGEVKVSKSGSSPETTSWVVVPSIGDGFAGAGAATRF